MPLITDGLDVLQSLVPLANARIVEAGCGAAQLDKNLLTPVERLRFEKAGA